MRHLHSVGNAPALRFGGALTDLDTSNLPCELVEGRREEYEIMHCFHDVGILN